MMINHQKPVNYADEYSNSSQGSTSNKHNVAKNKIIIDDELKPVPIKDADGFLVFADHPEFRPNLTPKEVLQLGSFGGTYFRSISSGVTRQTYHDAWKEFPADWFDKLAIRTQVFAFLLHIIVIVHLWLLYYIQVASQTYSTSVNTYRVSCGGDLAMWENSGWITEADPYGWFQWYCRFYLGRRCSDDERQISRALGVMGPTGRWRRNLLNKVLASKPLEEAVEKVTISPKVRQLLQHWGYRLTLKDAKTFAVTTAK
jgi:hypothetical protein